jgi:hypothetical protein
MHIFRLGILLSTIIVACLFACGCGDGGAECGNNKIEGDEVCDGTQLGGQTCSGLGHVGGDLGCTDSCTFDESACSDCGDGDVDDGEECDESDLDDQTCLTLNHDGGELACNNDCTFDESGCCDITGPDPCDGQTCSGHGTCMLVDCAATCECDAGYIQLDDLVCSESTCVPPDQVPDPWAMTFRPYDFSTRAPVSGALVEVFQSDGTLLDSGTSGANGEVQLSLATGGKPIDGYWMVSKTGYMPSRFRIQGGLGFFSNWSSMMIPEQWADDFVQDLWGVARDPAAAMVFLGLFECGQGSEYFGVPGATVSFSPAGADPVYMTAGGVFEPALTDTTAFGDVVAANLPAGDNTIAINLAGQDLAYQRTMAAGTWEVNIVYPRAEDEVPACAPGDVSAFELDWKPCGGLAQGVCTDGQVADHIAACWGATATAETCAAWVEDPNNADCNACIYVPYHAQNWNALVNYYELGFADLAANQCVSAYEGDLSENSCGAKLEAVRQCATYACKNNCPIRPNDFAADLAELNSCFSQALSGDCASYKTESDACSSTLLNQGDPVDQCLRGQGEDFMVWTERVAILICGDGTVGP